MASSGEGRPGGAATRYKRYPAYKDSGVEWLGEIPAGWHADRLKYRIHINPTDHPAVAQPLDTEVSFIPMEAIGEQGELDLSRRKPADEIGPGYTPFRENDVIVAKITPCFENGKGAIATGLTGGKAFGTTELQVLRPLPGVNNRFLYYLTMSHAFRHLGKAEMYGAGGQKRVPDDFIANLRHPLPDYREQAQIVRFIDGETARIDLLIAKNERLIELLREKRSAMISHAVVKGLNPDVRMKDSGVEWIGNVPAHWQVDRIKWAARMDSGHTPDKKVESYWANGNIPWVSLADTAQLREVDYIEKTAVQTTAEGIAHSSAHVLPPRTVVFSRDATIGLCGILKTDMAVSQHFIAWACSKRLRPEYLLFVLRSMTKELDRLTMGATVRTIGMPDVKSLATPIPPLSEQEEIFRYIWLQRRQIDALITKVQEAIERLREFRTALISAAVTGKIDVREEVS